MGGNMAARYLAAHYPVVGEARDRASVQWLANQGLRWSETPREVAATADVVFTSLPDDDVVEAVAAGPDGLLAGLGAGDVWVDVSTISPAASRRLAPQVREQGAELLDAPVSGSVPQVKTGTLTIMVGGDADAYARVEPLLRVIGTPTRVGDNGQGLVLKLAINISLAVQMLAFSEGLELARREGVDTHLAAQVMSESPIGSPMLKARVPLVLDQPDETWFDVAFMHKDIRLALATAEADGAPLPTAHAADEILRRASELGCEHRDIAVMFELLGRIGGPARTT
jgi:3-hydroxyisobutyrate dehydrogenase-like beta-hydroxyacid dehydrogenase